MKLDLGCGKEPQEGYVGVDLPSDETTPGTGFESFQSYVDPGGIVRFDLACGIPWPFETDSVDGLFSSHVIEHLPARRISVYEWAPGTPNQLLLSCTGTQDALFWFLDEAWRVTRPGGELLLRWPALRDANTGAFQLAPFLDPTHYRHIPVEQALYWSRAGRVLLGVEQYRARCNWVVRRQSQRELGGGSLRILETELLLGKEE